MTGSTGQVGSEVVRQLVARGDEVRCLVRDPERARLLDGVEVERVQGDVTAPETLGRAMHGCEAVIHLAGTISYLAKHRKRQEMVNVGGTRNVLDAAAAAGVRRVVYTSSMATLGYVDGDGEGDEDTAYNWGRFRLGYMDTKRVAEGLVLSDTRVEGVAVNPGIIFGARDIARNGGRMLLSVMNGGPIAHPCGATTCANLTDVAAGHLLALDRAAPGRRYVLGGTTGSFGEIFELLARVVGVEPSRRSAGPLLLWLAGAGQELGALFRAGEPPGTRALSYIASRNRRYSSARAIRELGYAPQPLEVGVRACLDWYLAEGIAV